MAMIDRLRAIVEPIVADLDLELFDLEYSGSTLTVTIDRPPSPEAGPDQHGGGVSIADITTVTRAVSRSLDEIDPIPGHYKLEVSSPGLERPLRTPVHFQRAVGQKVTVKTVPGFEGGRRLKGQLVRAGDGTPAASPDDDPRPRSIEVVLDEPAGVIVTVGYDQIDRARTVFEWGGEPKKAATPRTKAAKAPKAGTPAGAKAKAKAKPEAASTTKVEPAPGAPAPGSTGATTKHAEQKKVTAP